MTYADDGIGGKDDRFTLVLKGNEVKIAESYEIKNSILTQPAAFSLRLGSGATAKTIMNEYPPNTPFELRINDVVYQTGLTDGYSAGGNPTQVTIEGRDMLANLHDAYIDKDVSFKDVTYAQLVEKAFLGAGYERVVLKFTNRDNRKKKTGTKVKELGEPRSVGGDKIEALSGKGQQRAAQAKVGDKWYDFLKRHLDRAGLFLWAASDGEFILSEPNTKQAPTYRIVRQRGLLRNAVSVLSASHQNKTSGRFSACLIYARAGSRVFGRTESKGDFIDPEMTNTWKYHRPLVARDVNATNREQAEFYARRRLAETRRAGWQLTYTVAGHTTPSLQGGMAVWAPDTIVEVTDDEYGLKGNFWIESVTFQRNPHATTTIRLMRDMDLIFGEL